MTLRSLGSGAAVKVCSAMLGVVESLIRVGLRALCRAGLCRSTVFVCEREMGRVIGSGGGIGFLGHGGLWSWE